MKGVQLIGKNIEIIPWSILGITGATIEGEIVIRSERIMHDGTAQTLESVIPCKLPLDPETVADLQTTKEFIGCETGWHVEITVVGIEKEEP